MNSATEKQHSGDRLLNVVENYLNLPQAEVARLLEITPQRLSNWIKRGIPSGEIRKVAQALHVRRDYLELDLGPIFAKGYDELQLGWQKGFARIAERKAQYEIDNIDDELLREIIDTYKHFDADDKRLLVQIVRKIRPNYP